MSLICMSPDFFHIVPFYVSRNNALLEAERLAEATKNALKRKIEQAASSDYQSKTLPAKLKIDPNDPEDVVSQKDDWLFVSFFTLLL